MRWLILLTLLLSACGQSGELYLPVEQPAPQAAPPAAPAPPDEKKDEP